VVIAGLPGSRDLSFFSIVAINFPTSRRLEVLSFSNFSPARKFPPSRTMAEVAPPHAAIRPGAPTPCTARQLRNLPRPRRYTRYIGQPIRK
jgi:hypothetical protein